MTELPSIKEELTRKTFDELERLINYRELGKITNAEYLASVTTLFSICSGLVDNNFFEVISKASEEAERDYSMARTRLFRKGNNVVVISRTHDDSNRFAVKTLKCEIKEEKDVVGERDETDTNIDTEMKLQHFIDRLIFMGYKAHY